VSLGVCEQEKSRVKGWNTALLGSLSVHIVILKNEAVARSGSDLDGSIIAPSNSHPQFASNGFRRPPFERSPVAERSRHKDKVINELRSIV